MIANYSKSSYPLSMKPLATLDSQSLRLSRRATLYSCGAVRALRLCGGCQTRLPDERSKQLGPLVAHTAEELTQRLGGLPHTR